MTVTKDELMQLAVETAAKGMTDGRGGPFGALVAKGGQVIAVGSNRVVRDCDPTAHAEICAIRSACVKLGDHRLKGCDIYATCEPCPMCLAAIYWARLDRIYYASTRDDAADIGFDDALIYREVSADLKQRELPMIHLPSDSSRALFTKWEHMATKVPY